MKRYALLLTAMTITAAVPRLHAQPPAAAPAAGQQEPAPAAPQQGGRGRGRGQTTATAATHVHIAGRLTDNKVPAALAREGFTAIFNGKDLSGWQALIDIGTLTVRRGPRSCRSAEALTGRESRQAEDVDAEYWSTGRSWTVSSSSTASKRTS